VIALPDYRLAPLLWVAVSVLLYLAGTHLRDLAGRPARIATLDAILSQPAVRVAVGALYYLGLPYLALLRGDLLPRLFGLAELNWPADISAGAAFATGALALTLIAFYYARGVDAGQSRAIIRRPGSMALLWPAILMQVHWTFYRAALSQVLDDTYWGAFASLIPVAIETVLDPGLRRWPGSASAGLREIARFPILAVSTTMYLFVRNLPILIVVHWVADMALAGLFTPRRTTPHAASDTWSQDGRETGSPSD